MPDGFVLGDLRGLHHVALDAHFYPGFFGWGEPAPQVHLDWLTKGVLGKRSRRRCRCAAAVGDERRSIPLAGAEMTARSFATYAGFGYHPLVLQGVLRRAARRWRLGNGH
jgi:hypothetical protein